MQIDTSTNAMLEAIDSEIERLQERLRTLEARKKTLATWLAEEEPQASLPGVKHMAIPPRPPRVPLIEFLKETIEDGKARTNEELADAAQARGIIPAGEKVDLRSVNSLMLSLMNGGLVRRSNGKWVKN
jgi:hypothetical protein